jgi:hypothetical protein
MRGKLTFSIVIALALLASLILGAVADDGAMHRRNISGTPDQETEDALISMMYVYVPAQKADKTQAPVEYYFDLDGDNVGETLFETRNYAKPLISTYIDELEHEDNDLLHQVVGGLGIEAVSSGMTMGAFDTFGAVSLDDGTTWKSTNISRAADQSSFKLADGTPYPGSTGSAVHAVAGDRVMVAWTSRYCDGGEPNYTLTITDTEALRTLSPDLAVLYFEDLFGVMGNQKSVDYTAQGFPEVGEIPYACVWTARGSLEPIAVTDELGATSTAFDIIWYKAERLTSGKRDANRVEISGVEGAGFAILWQEDPEGLRPGQGLGPGEGWSGAIVNAKTDIWYSYIDWDDFDWVKVETENLDGSLSVTYTLIADYVLTGDEPTPKPAVPMAMPIRVTDNAACKAVASLTDPLKMEDPYCYYDFDSATIPDLLPTTPTAESDFCASHHEWTSPGGTTLDICVTEDGRTLTGRVGASRVRFNMWPRDTDNDGLTDSAWIVMAYEETKALGYTADELLELDPIDIGKNIWYHSFDMFTPDMVAQGGMLNQPSYPLDPTTGTFGADFVVQVDEFGYEYYETEIARRFSLVSQPLENALLGTSGTTAFLTYKQGILYQGGPADILARRLVLPTDFDPLVDNPYDYKNMVCTTWAYADGANPNYLQGICLDPAVNVSATNIVRCDTLAPDVCAASFSWEGGVSPFPKVYEWSQDIYNLDDQSWENPYDVAKGHRGFIDGDFLMVLYAWSPNWQSNAVGNDHYNLYIRRSFDGGQTWTTTPSSLGGTGTSFVEYYYNTSVGDLLPVTLTYGPDEFEQARNVSLLTGNRETILDPRYSPTGGLKLIDEVKLVDSVTYTDALPYWDDDGRDPSKYFVVFETGDNTTVAEGEAVPLDLFYSRGTMYGDFYATAQYYATGSTGLVYEYWDWLEKKAEDLSGEASITANLSGNFMYAVWNQWNEFEEEVVSNSDNWFRRLMYNDTDIPIAPSTYIIFTSHTSMVDYTAGTLTLVGAAKDNDRLGDGPDIQAYQWRLKNASGSTSEVGDEQVLSIPVTDLSLGLNTFTFVAQDNEGDWSRGSTISLIVYEKIPTTTLYLPLLGKK